MSASEKLSEFLKNAESEGMNAFGHYQFVRDGLLLLAAEIDSTQTSPDKSSGRRPTGKTDSFPLPPKG